MELSNTDLLSLQTAYMQQDPFVKALCKALEPYFKMLDEDIRLTYIYGRIDELGEEVVDSLAWQFHVDFYDYTLSLEKKRELVKNSLRLHRIKGTPQAVIEAVKIIFDNIELQEWFQYDGEPYFFRLNVDIENEIITEENTKKVSKLINSYKNLRSWLEILNFNSYINGNYYSAIKVSEYKIESINTSFDFTERIKNNNYFSGSISSIITQTITMKQPENIIWGALKVTNPTWSDESNSTWLDTKTY